MHKCKACIVYQRLCGTHVLKQPCESGKKSCYRDDPKLRSPKVSSGIFKDGISFIFCCTFDCSSGGRRMHRNRKKFISPGCMFSPSLAFFSRSSFDDRVGIKVLSSLPLLLKGLNLISLHRKSLLSGPSVPVPKVS